MTYNLEIEFIIETIYDLMLTNQIEEKTGDRLLEYYYELQEQGKQTVEFYSELKF